MTEATTSIIANVSKTIFSDAKTPYAGITRIRCSFLMNRNDGFTLSLYFIFQPDTIGSEERHPI